MARGGRSGRGGRAARGRRAGRVRGHARRGGRAGRSERLGRVGHAARVGTYRAGARGRTAGAWKRPQTFDRARLRASLERAGVEERQAREVTNTVAAKVKPGTKPETVLKSVMTELKKGTAPGTILKWITGQLKQGTVNQSIGNWIMAELKRLQRKTAGAYQPNIERIEKILKQLAR